MKVLFYDLNKLEEFILENELNYHYSFLDKYYFVGKLDKKMKDKYKNIIEINKEDIKKYKYDNIEEFKYSLDIIKFKKKYTFEDIKLKKINNCFHFNISSNRRERIIFEKDIEYDLKDLYHQENILKITKRVIDDFAWNKYSPLTHKTKSLKTLKKYIGNNYEKEVSQPFLKMYEILETFKLFKGQKEFKTFHFCEAPGQFIKSIDYFLKSKHKKLDWYAQSLKVTNENKNTAFGDEYNLIRDNPERWSYGPNGTGDITNENVIKSYREICEGVTLITSDCGSRSMTPYDMTYQDKILAYLNFCQILAILYNLPQKGNFVAKVFLPQTVNYIVSLNYLLANNFENFYVYKPYLNPSSSEVYLIGKNYNRLDDKILDKLFKIKDKLDITKGFLKIDNTFLKEYQKCFIKFIKNNLDKIRQNIYFYLNNTKFDSMKLNEIQNDNNIFWIEKFNFVKLKKEKFYL